jgi:hypothetical protein
LRAVDLDGQMIGTEPLIVDPWPGRDSHRTVPPMAPSRSDMFTNP